MEPLRKLAEIVERALELSLGPIDTLPGGVGAGVEATPAQLLGKPLQPLLRAFV